MGNLLTSLYPTPSAEQKRMRVGGGAISPPTPSSEPLFLDEVKAEPASWSEESYCRIFQRFIGLLPDSAGEILKQEQQYPLFKHRTPAYAFVVGDHMSAIIAIQRSYRRYHRLRNWHKVADHILLLARARLAELRVQEEEDISAANFRALMAKGFSASKVCISGGLKTIQLRMVLNSEAGECYLTWTPSRKKKPRIDLHDISQVVAVQKEGNVEAPRLAKKVSHRRGLIIVCKSYHRGRVVLELSSKQERNLLVRGFQRLLDEMSWGEPALDSAGAIRKQLPRRQSVLDFFAASRYSQFTTSQVDAEFTWEPQTPVDAPQPETLADQALRVHTESAWPDAKAIKHFYQTRFDDSPGNAVPVPPQPSRTSSRAMQVRN